MLSHGLQAIFTDIPLTVTGLLFFLVAHASIIGRLCFSPAESFDHLAELPLSDEEPRA